MLVDHLFILAKFILITTVHFIAGVKIKSIGLKSGEPFVHHLLSANIQFDAAKEPNEIIQSVKWVLNDGAGEYVWTDNGLPKVSGNLVGTLNTSAENGELFITYSELSHAGNYTLTVTSNLGTDTGTYNLIVYYKGAISFNHSPFGVKLNCTDVTYLFISGIAPYPNISLAAENKESKPPIYVPLHEVAEVNETITDYNDGTFDYEMTAIVPVLKIPLESFYVWDFWIYDNKIRVFGVKYNSVSGTPCPEPDAKDGLNYTIVQGEKSCRGGYSTDTKMDYFCVGNPKSEPHKTIKCVDYGKWNETDETPWPVCRNSGESVLGFQLLGRRFLCSLTLLVIPFVCYFNI